jgi:rubrerythrin
MIARAADKAWLDFRAFENEDHQASEYRSGEVCNAGRFSCNNCGNSLDLSKTGQLPRCPVCDHGEFYRVIG